MKATSVFHKYIVLHATSIELMRNFTSLASALRTRKASENNNNERNEEECKLKLYSILKCLIRIYFECFSQQ